MAKIGFVGLGTMGNAMAQNLLKKGLDLMVFDVRAEAMETVINMGAKAATLEEMANECDSVLIMVQTASQVDDVLKAIASNVDQKKGLTAAIMSTITPKRVKEIAARYISKGIDVFDAPVSGAQILAQAGMLSIMVGGTEEQMAKFRPAFEAMGRSIFYIGPLGQGAAMKVVNNLPAIANMMITPAALKIGMAAGINLKKMVEVINASTGRNFIIENWEMALGVMQIMVGTKAAAENQLKINEKDIRAFLELTDEVGLSSAIGEAVLSMTTSQDQPDLELLNQFKEQMV